MLRELAEALESITVEQPLVLVLEDLHWSDAATLEFLSVLARRRESARLLVIGTYRPAEVLVQEHPLRGVKQELQVHAQCQEMLLDFLTLEEVTEYLLQRFGEAQPQESPNGLARFIHQRTDGNPLFMVNVVDYLVTQDLIREVDGGWELHGWQEQIDQTTVGMPDSLRQMIEKQIDQLGPEVQNVLEVASVAGADFSAATLSAGIESSVVQVEELCERLVRRHQFLQANGIAEWPDGTVASRYCFIHALYQEVLYGRVTGARRVQIHQRTGQRQEAGYGERAGEIAAELAGHFERGRDYARAIQYRQHAGENDIQRSAHKEAITLLTKAMELLSKLPLTAERMQQELSLHIALGGPLIAIKGYAAAEVETTYTRARELCQQLGETSQLFSALYGLWAFHQSSADLRTAHDLAQQLLQLARTRHEQTLLAEAHRACGGTLQMLGEFPAALEHLNQGITLAHRHGRDSHSSHSPADLEVACLAYAALVQWFLGYPEQALARMGEALVRARTHDVSPLYASFCPDLVCVVTSFST